MTLCALAKEGTARFRKSINEQEVKSTILSETLERSKVRCQELALECAILEVACRSDQKLIGEFHDSISTAKKTYDEAARLALNETYQELLSITNIPQSAGFLLDIFTRTANLLLSSHSAFDEFSTFLEEEQPKARASKIADIKKKKDGLEKRLDALHIGYKAAHKLIEDIALDEKLTESEKESAHKILLYDYTSVTRVAQKTFQMINDMLSDIKQLMTIEKNDIQKQHIQTMMSTFMVRGHTAARAYRFTSPRTELLKRFTHFVRRRKLAALSSSETLRRQGFSIEKKLKKKDRQYLYPCPFIIHVFRLQYLLWPKEIKLS